MATDPELRRQSAALARARRRALDLHRRILIASAGGAVTLGIAVGIVAAVTTPGHAAAAARSAPAASGSTDPSAGSPSDSGTQAPADASSGPSSDQNGGLAAPQQAPASGNGGGFPQAASGGS